MERILIRAGVAPWAEYNALDVITDKIIGNNTGNLLFANSITRLVATADSRVDFISDLTLVKKQITAQEINENYDRLILPMANAFREDFARKCLKHWTALIRQLTIPVTVTGIGIQLPYEPHLEQPREFDGAARDFIAAVLDHSASVGVRGQITYDYLKGLGFSQIDVTGCPSLALNGPGLPLREAAFDPGIQAVLYRLCVQSAGFQKVRRALAPNGSPTPTLCLSLLTICG